MQAEPPTFDLQAHSIHSDGELPPAAVVRLAADAGVELLALTDHDTVGGTDEALRAGSEHGVRVVAATELSAVYERYEDLHVLGYCVDHRNHELARALESFRRDRVGRADRMAELLREVGFSVDATSLETRRFDGKPVGRPHLAAAVVNDDRNMGRLRSQGIADVSALIERYLIPGRPAYVPRTHPTVEEAIALIHAAGGLAVWAHPFWDVSEGDRVRQMVDEFVRHGLDGVEVFYATHSREQTHLLADECERRAILMTGSADFHGLGHRLFNRFRAFELHGRTPVLEPIRP
jgi:predicted metal-dependent phosphoesterase TrpH